MRPDFIALKFICYLREKFRQMKLLLIGLSGMFLLSSCGGEDANGTEEITDSTEVSENDEDIVDPNYLYIGDERGDYLLYGYEDIKVEHAVDLSEFSTAMSDQNEFTGVLSVTIDEVCQKAGCWIIFNDSNGEPIRVFFRDHFTIPTETATGTQAILAGVTLWDTMNVDTQLHLLEDKAEAGGEVSQEEKDAITDDIVELTFDCDAILVAKQ